MIRAIRNAQMDRQLATIQAKWETSPLADLDGADEIVEGFRKARSMIGADDAPFLQIEDLPRGEIAKLPDEPETPEALGSFANSPWCDGI